MWITHPRPNARPRLRLFCLPYAGGGANLFRRWPGRLPRDVDVCPIHLPGRDARLMEPAYHQVEPLVEALASALRPYLDVPFALYGYSMGALIGFEVARAIRRRYGLEPARLLVAAHRAPHLPDRRPPIYHLPEAQFIAELRRLQGTPEEVLAHAELMQLLLPRLRADMELCDTYRYVDAPPLRCPISAFGGWEDEEVLQEELDGWREQTTGTFHLRMYGGGHFFAQQAEDDLLMAVTAEVSAGFRNAEVP